MINLLFWLLVSWFCVGLIFRTTAKNIGAPWNGIGAIVNNLKGVSKAPMQYRMLQAWFVKFVARATGLKKLELLDVNGRLVVRYVFATMLALAFALWAAQLYFNNLLYTIILLVLLLSTTVYDYMDKYFELGFFALCFYGITTGQIWIAMIATVLGSFNKESSLLQVAIPLVIPFTAIFTQIKASFILMICWLVPYLLLRKRYGVRESYVPAVIEYATGNKSPLLFGFFATTWPLNRKFFRELNKINDTMWNSLILIALSLLSLFINPTYLIFVASYLILITLTGSLREPRIYNSLSLVFIPVLGGLII